MFLSKEAATMAGALGMVLLAISWHKRRNEGVSRLAQVGWILVGFYFFNDSRYYFEINDLVLTIMTALALPIAVALVIAEARSLTARDRAALNWARGCVAYAGGPYLLVAHIPWLSVLAIWFVASQVAMFLSFTGTADIKLGNTYVNTDDGRQYLWEEWDGNKWFMTDGFAEHPFQTELIMADGGFIGINFVLACTALQSMIVFVGAISVLDVERKRRIRALLFTVPIIHILNLFRNAGLIWMHRSYEGWEYLGLSMFEFGHSYASRVVSLFAMFIMAIAMFELLPELHRHILRLLESAGLRKKKQRTNP
ncbi:MAG: archaeosortase A [Euryarchaeota archaeon]|jgi:archaeosortase A (PGF-CTERM-specific)|nr:archaeosortase A [Euryarchaeota archaeon]DAC42965.1 MAG TPA: archaeosortase A [Candidatus Poseidoniales archaeon]HII24179.1 archaeosortase A [Candidatus Poseidoniaceae archaeon]|tara:strand:+ start:2286 stop:3215 length:930 start_codon:yes stop_codon:yes gene_type:complete